MKIKITATEEDLASWALDMDFIRGGIYEVEPDGDDYFICSRFCYNIPSKFGYIVVENPNREYLRDFIKLNNINVSAVSRYLGHTRSWLATMYLNRKYDITDETLKSIIKKLHIDWASNEFIHVKKTKQHTAYRIKPTSCVSEKSRVALQETMWKGLFTF